MSVILKKACMHFVIFPSPGEYYSRDETSNGIAPWEKMLAGAGEFCPLSASSKSCLLFMAGAPESGSSGWILTALEIGKSDHFPPTVLWMATSH